MKKLFIGLSLPILLAFSSCKDEKAPSPEVAKGALHVEIDHVFAGEQLRLRTKEYSNHAGEALNVEMLQYYVSNFKWYKADGTEYVVPQDDCYFLINEHMPESKTMQMQVPEGAYTKLVFTLGVDSLRSTMDIDRRTGVLDPAAGMDDGMYWGWNSGYIFFKLEGISPVVPADGSGQRRFRYHIGGFGGYDMPTINNIREVTIHLDEGEAKVRKDGRAKVHLYADIARVFDGPHNVTLAEFPAVMFSTLSLQVSENYAQMFSHNHTENE